MKIKIKLTLKLLLSMVVVFYITLAVYIIMNIMIFNSKISFSKDLFNLSFSPADFIEKYVDDLAESEELILNEENINKLVANNIWIQVLDENNREVYTVNKPENIPSSYLLPDLIEFIENPWGSKAPTTISTRNISRGNENYTLLMGFPIDKLSRVKITYTNDFIKYHSLIILLAVLLMTLMTYLFSRSIVKPMVSVVNDIDDLKNGLYSVKKEKKGVYKF